MRDPTSEELQVMIDNLPPGEIAEVKDDVQDLALESMLERISELNIKVVNLAVKLDQHMSERDAHNPAIMRTK